MKIAYILPSLVNMGPGIVVKDLCVGFVERGHQCKVFYFDDNNELNFPCPTERISFSKKINFDEWDVVHSHMFRPDMYIWLHTRGNHKKYNCKFITTLHNPIDYKNLNLTYGSLYSFLGSFFWPKSLSAFNQIVALSEELKLQTSSLIKNKSKIKVIYNGRNIDIKAPVFTEDEKNNINELKSKYKIIGTVSRITKRKGLDQLIYALTDLPDFATIIVGDGPELENLKNLAIEKNVSERCYFVGYKPYSLDFYSQFDMFVMCTHSEGFPLALIEAAAYSLPTVLSNIEILLSIVPDTVCKFYQLGDYESLVNAINECYENREYYSVQMSKYYNEILTRDVMIDNYLNIYMEDYH